MVPPSRAWRSLASAALAMALCAAPSGAQSMARVRVEENVRREPNGEVVARVEPGATLSVVGRRDRWLEVDLEGWVWSRSLQTTDQGDFDLVVAEAQGENLRATPSGDIVGRLGRGTLLDEVERGTGWIRVRRRAWIWAGSVVETSTPLPASREAPAESPARAPGGVVTTGEGGAAVLTAPDGDTLARAAPGADLQVLSREGNWARVRVEGWTWLPQRAAQAPAAEATAPSALTPAELTAQPEAHRGRIVSWVLQYISLERAEKVRTDFLEGEPFLLTRFGGADGPFVYVAVPADRVQDLQGLVPLERLRVTGRVRTGASSLTGTPILDLVALERVRTPE